MKQNLILFKDMGLFTEFFLGVSAIYLLLHCVLIKKKSSKLFNDSIINLSVLVLMFSLLLTINDLSLANNTLIFNNSIVVDQLGVLSKCLVITISVAFLLLIKQQLKNQKINNYEYLILLLISLLGILLLCCSNDLMTAYLSIELQSLAFYVMASFKRTSVFSVDAGLKYFIIGSFASSLFLFGSSLVYGLMGTLNIDDFKDLMLTDSPLNITKVETFDLNLIFIPLLIILISLFIKLAVAPFHLWLPDVYEGSPTPTSMFFAIVPKIAILVFLSRLYLYSFNCYIESYQPYIIILIVLTVLVGAFGGLEQRKLKSLLAYSSIGHMGYILLAFSTGTLEGFQMFYLYIIIYMLSGLSLWSFLLLFKQKTRYFIHNGKSLSNLALLSKSNKTAAIMLSVILLSVAGFPPFIGFFAKMSVFMTAIESSFYVSSSIIIICSVLSTFYYIRIIKIMFFEKLLVGKLYYPLKTHVVVILTLSFFLLIFLFFNPTLLYLITYKINILFLT